MSYDYDENNLSLIDYETMRLKKEWALKQVNEEKQKVTLWKLKTYLWMILFLLLLMFFCI